MAHNLTIESIFNTAEYINNDENVQINYTEENFNKLIDIKSSPKNKLIKKTALEFLEIIKTPE